MTTSDQPCRLYLISQSEIADADAFAATLDGVFKAGDVACFQLRLKGASDDAVVATAKTLMPVCEAHDVALLINDRADLAHEADVDGVHLGQGDGSVKKAKELLGLDRIVGVTCHNSLHLAFAAGEQGADYVAFGAFYPTETKKTEYHAEKDILTRWDEIVEIPSVAIGGITTDTAAELKEAGAHFIAVCSAVWQHADGPAAAVRAFNQILAD
ncbi:thiamine-phosphate synthase [Kordiimonas sediminis]|uniref:Thiamine-phosphate synthase n=1 Tax=Kordiimonas sediminis TaxID=1735581 RepID=A0A919AQG0_9PROT|nr:thiamine phosphate synthase [Kordiimonas sediminis]GHF20124.1 thiamine-phosphate synthase [Kordiimonas sediminis]